MNNNTNRLLIEEFGISEKVLELVNSCEQEIKPLFDELDDIMTYNQYKVLDAFHKNNISDRHFAWNTGYGYDDMGREATERLFADVFHAEAALVRPIIVNGTHALSLALTGVLRPGDHMIYSTGGPYDTLEETIGIRGKGKGTLMDYGVTYDQVELTSDGSIDFDALAKAIKPETRMVCLQRSTGYGWRKAITIEQIAEWASFVHGINPDLVCMVDNCYGEFLHTKEPTDVGADIMAGSLIKNPGGGLALTGGYIAGRKDLVDKIYYRVTCPGIGGECGLTFGQTRAMMEGLFIAPRVTAGAVKGAKLCAKVYEDLGYKTCPKSTDKRSDIIEAVVLGSSEKVEAFCRGVQKAAPVESYVTPEYGEMAGYKDDIIMAAGAFVQGSSIELSADSPKREPYIVYFQGGITYEHSKFGVIMSLHSLKRKGLI